MRWLLLFLAAIPAFALWSWVVFIGTSDGWFRTPLAPAGDAEAFAAAASDYLDAADPGNAAFRLLENGRVVGEHYVSAGAPVDAHSVFQMASVSKWFTAWGVMALVEQGRVDLDEPAARYLSRWRLPESEFDNDQVTVRRLLSHTAGLTDRLGYGGFGPGEPIQSLEDSLTQAADAMGGADGQVRVGEDPGAQWLYSGGGYALLQLLIEEVSGQDFETFMQRTVLVPLGMRDSTFDPDRLTSSLVAFYDVGHSPAPHYRYAAVSAAGLYTSAADLTRFLTAQLPGGAPPGGGVLQPETLVLMRTPHASSLGTEIWGLGEMLYARNRDGNFIIGHDGGNRPAINTSVRLDPDSGDGIILLTTGQPGLASRLAGEWIFWQAGKLDIGAFYAAGRDMIVIIVAGWIVIIAAVLLIGWRANKPDHGEST